MTSQRVADSFARYVERHPKPPGLAPVGSQTTVRTAQVSGQTAEYVGEIMTYVIMPDGQWCPIVRITHDGHECLVWPESDEQR